MSIAPLAAKRQSPIIVSPEAGLTESAKNLLDREDAINKVQVIGGSDKVSANVMADVKKVGEDRKSQVSIDVERISGQNRQETNAKVLGLYRSVQNTTQIMVAKDGMVNNSQLVDALTASVLGNPMVLSTNRLTDSQIEAIDKLDKGDGSTPSLKTELVQVGLGIASNVMDKIVSLISNDK